MLHSAGDDLVKRTEFDDTKVAGVTTRNVASQRRDNLGRCSWDTVAALVAAGLAKCDVLVAWKRWRRSRHLDGGIHERGPVAIHWGLVDLPPQRRD